MVKMSKEMSEETFNEIVDGFEYIRTLTEWGSKNIKQHIQRLQQENKSQKEVIDKVINIINEHFKHHPELLTENQIEYDLIRKIENILKEVSE